MSRTRSDSNKHTAASQDSFLHAVEQALEHINDLDWLGTTSPLALPYMLNRYWPDNATLDKAKERGQVLRGLLAESAEELAQDQKKLLEVAYFARNPSLKSYGVAQQLGLAESTFFRQRAPALQAVADELHRILHPAIRAEHPVSKTLFGREVEFAECFSHLCLSQTVALTGQSGIGKTALGAAMAECWQQQAISESDAKKHVFWFTLRTGLNDTALSFLFVLAHFLRDFGMPTLWRQLIADQGVIQVKHILGVVRNELYRLRDVPHLPLFCIDEIDLLNSEYPEHAHLIDLLEELRQHVPLLLMGQRMVIEPNYHHVMKGLSVDGTKAWLDAYNIALPINHLIQLTEVTKGNAALIALFTMSEQIDDSPSDLFEHFILMPTADYLLERIWKRLNEPERSLLIQFSVIRGSIPRDFKMWNDRRKALAQLIDQKLLQAVGPDELTLAKDLREFIVARMPSDMKLACHLVAAELRETSGQFTEAAYHYIEGRQPAMAIWLWWTHRWVEKEHGQTQTAYNLFRQIDAKQLVHDKDQATFALLLAFLAELQGQNDQMQKVIDNHDWSKSSWATPTKARLRGIAYERQGMIEAAVDQYRRGIEAAMDSVPTQLVQLHLGLGHLYLDRLSDPTKASIEATMAGIWSERFLGIVAEHSGDFGLAHDHYARALGLTEKLNRDRQSIRARVLQDIGILAWKQGRSEEALARLLEVDQIFDTQGDFIRLAVNKINLSAAYIVANQFEKALSTAQEALKNFEQTHNSFLVAGLMSNAGEACFYLEKLDDAEWYANQCLHFEEPAHQVNAITVLGMVQRARRQFSQAESSFMLAIQTAIEYRDLFGEAPAWRNLGQLYEEQGRITDAKRAYKNAIRLYRELGLSHEIETTCRLVNVSVAANTDSSE